MPVRKDTGLSTVTYTETTVRNYAPGTTYSNYVGEARRSWMAGHLLSNFHARKRRGELLPHTAFDQVEWEGRHTYAVFSWGLSPDNKKADIYNHKGPAASNRAWRVADFSGYDCDPTSNADDSQAIYLLQQAASRIYNQGWDALTFAGELPELKRQFKGITKRMVDLAKGKSAKRIHSAWLEARYGWRTLAYDVADMHQAALHFDAKRRIWSERAGYSYQQHTYTELSGLNFGGYFDETGYWDQTDDFSVRGSLTGRFRPSRVILNPVKTAWELVPYSFVVDWVYGVGVALDALAFHLGSPEYTASYGFQCDTRVVAEAEGTANSSTPAYARVRYEYTGKRQKRVPTTLSFTPQLTNRRLTPDLSLDLQALSRLRARL